MRIDAAYDQQSCMRIKLLNINYLKRIRKKSIFHLSNAVLLNCGIFCGFLWKLGAYVYVVVIVRRKVMLVMIFIMML